MITATSETLYNATLKHHYNSRHKKAMAFTVYIKEVVPQDHVKVKRTLQDAQVSLPPRKKRVNHYQPLSESMQTSSSTKPCSLVSSAEADIRRQHR